MNREAIQAALFNLISVISGLSTTGRRLIHWTDMAPTDQPALFLVPKSETITNRPGLPPKHVIELAAYLYAHGGDDPAVAPAQILNPLIDAIEAALAPDSPGQDNQTLGGLVQHVWIDGKIETDEGALGAQSVVIIPITILVP